MNTNAEEMWEEAMDAAMFNTLLTQDKPVAYEYILYKALVFQQETAARTKLNTNVMEP